MKVMTLTVTMITMVTMAVMTVMTVPVVIVLAAFRCASQKPQSLDNVDGKGLERKTIIAFGLRTGDLGVSASKSSEIEVSMMFACDGCLVSK